MQNGANKKLKDYSGNNGMHFFVTTNFYTIHLSYMFSDVYKMKMKNKANIKGQTPLHIACLNPNRDCVRQYIEYLVKKGFDVNTKDFKGNTPLHYYSCHENLFKYYNDYNAQLEEEGLDILLKECEDINTKNNKGETPLHIACKGNLRMINHLVLKGADLNAVDNEGNTPLHFIAENVTDEKTIDFFLLHCREVDVMNKKRQTPLLIACKNKNTHLAFLLLKRKANPNVYDICNQYKTPLHYVCEQDNRGALYDLLNHSSPNVNVHLRCPPSQKAHNNETPLHVACEFATDVRMIEYLLKNKADPFAVRGDGKTCMDILYAREAFDFMPQFIAKGAPHYVNGESLLEISVKKSSLALLKSLIKYGCDINQKLGDTYALHIACMRHSNDIIEYLVKNGANVNSIADSKETQPTALMCAASIGNSVIVQHLIEKGADPNAHINNKTAMAFACDSNSLSCVKILHNSGVSVNDVIDDQNTTILHYACFRGVPKIVKYLIDNGAEVNTFATNRVVPGNLLHPLHYACYSGSKETAELILSNMKKE